MGACVPNLKFVSLAAIFELLAFNAPQIRGHVTLTTPLFPEFFSWNYAGTFPGASVPNLKFVSLAIFEPLVRYAVYHPA